MFLIQSLALDIKKTIPACCSGQPLHAATKNLLKEKSHRLSTFVACFSFFFFQWTELPLSSSGSRLRGMRRRSCSGGAASAVMLPLSYAQPEGYVPTLTQEHHLWLTTESSAYTSV